MSALVLIGAGGHCRALIDVIEASGRYHVRAIVGGPEERGLSLMGYPVDFTDHELPDLIRSYRHFLVAVGQIHTSTIRRRLFNFAIESGGKPATVISPHAVVSNYATVQAGTVVMHHAIINANARVGSNCIINSRALIEHDAVVGDCCHISTGAIVNGDTCVGEGSFVGSGTVLNNGIRIAEGSIVSAGQFVFRGEKFRGRKDTQARSTND